MADDEGTPTPPAPSPEGAPPAEPSGVSQEKVDSIVKERVNDTKKATEERIVKDLGVTLEEAKRLIAAAKTTEDSQKSEAQRAREQADAEKAAAETVKGESALARHQANVDRQILRAVSFPADMKDEDIDRKVDRISRLVDVETGADADAIRAAVKALKDDEPLLFGVADGGTGKPPATGDPAGTPPAKTGAEGAYERGAKRAKERNGAPQYEILAGAGEPTI